MKIKDEINYANIDDRECLSWLFANYRKEWKIVAKCKKERFSGYLFKTCRIWEPTKEGWILYKHQNEL